MSKWSKLVEFWTLKLFQICACMISAQKAKQLDTTTMFTYFHANTPLCQSERVLSYFVKVNSICRMSTWPVNKQVLAFKLFVCNSSHHTYYDCSMKKQPISTAVVLEFRELLKWITKSYWNLSKLSECKNICHCDRFIFYIRLWEFHNSNKSKLLTLIKNIHMFKCSTNFVLFASQLLPCEQRKIEGPLLAGYATNGSTFLLNENF